MSHSRWACVVPSNRPDSLIEFERAWQPIFSANDVRLITVHDQEPYDGIPSFIPRHTDMIRSWGFYKAYREGADYICSLDDDVRPLGYGLFSRYKDEFNKYYPCAPYLSTGALTNSGKQMRGFPYANRLSNVAVQYGGWHGVPDYDALTQTQHASLNCDFANLIMPVPRWAATTTCAMNFAFRAHYTPIMWQLPLFEGRYNRFGDIWSGLFAKKVLDNRGEVMLINGKASVIHERVSNVEANRIKESPGMPINEHLWESLAIPTSDSLIGAYKEVTHSAFEYFREHDEAYAIHFLMARNAWLALFD